MIQLGTKLKTIDNSGAKWTQCIHIFGGKKKKYAYIRDIVLIVVKSLKHRKKKQIWRVKKKTLYWGLIIFSNYKFHIYHNYYLTTWKSNLLVLSRVGKPLFSRIYGPMPKFYRKTKFYRLIGLAHGVV